MTVTRREARDDEETPWTAYVAADRMGVIIPAQRVVGLLTHQMEQRLREEGVIVTDENCS